MPMDYSLFYRREVDVNNIAGDMEEFDVYISAFNSSRRVTTVFSSVRAKRKIWLIHPEYMYSEEELPKGYPTVLPDSAGEMAQVSALLKEVGEPKGLKICVDITGFMRHVLVFLVGFLKVRGVSEFLALYSEPVAYSKQEDTIFSTATTGKVEAVKGMGGSSIGKAEDILILAVGYDYKLINEVTADKDYMPVYPIFGFPSLSPDMYQQSAIKSAESGSATFGATWFSNRRFAPANDPFATAGVVAEIVEAREKKNLATNIYLSPLSTKAQALGFALYWLYEQNPRRSIVMLLPTCATYSRETSTGLKRLWEYTVEMI